MHFLISPMLANFYYIGGGGLGLVLVIVIVVLLLRR
jgi:cellobiose-specific phosphotransferase system component IIC